MIDPDHPGFNRNRPRYPHDPALVGNITPEERARRKLEFLRWKRDHWRLRYEIAMSKVAKLEERRGWVEDYIGFRIEYRLRGYWRGVKRLCWYVPRRKVRKWRQSGSS